MSQNATSNRVPEIYRLALGSFNVVVIDDDHLQFPPEIAAATASTQELTRALHEIELNPDELLVLSLNVLVVNTGEHVVLIDTGAGTSRDKAGPWSGAGEDASRFAYTGRREDSLNV